MSRAREAGLDLVEVDSNGQPPVCRILDYGKFKYEQAKRERDGRKHQRGSMIHEVRMRPRTGQHDIDLKVRIANRLLAEGDKVKLSVMFRGREISHPEVGQEVLDKALEGLKEAANVEKPPGMEGRFLTVILTPVLKKPVTAAKSARPDGPPEAGSAPTAVSENGTAAEAPITLAEETTPEPEATVAEAQAPAAEVKTTAKAAKVDEPAAEAAKPAAAAQKAPEVAEVEKPAAEAAKPAAAAKTKEG
jgi:translation initiation factor IF-3